MKVLHLIPDLEYGNAAQAALTFGSCPGRFRCGVSDRRHERPRTAGRTFAVVSCRPSLPELETLDRFQTIGTLEPIDHGLLSRHHSLLATRIGSMLGPCGWTRRKTLASCIGYHTRGIWEKLEFRLLRRLDKIVFQWPSEPASGRLIFL